jgi:hypothetical protein
MGVHDHIESRSQQGTEQTYNRGCWIQHIHPKVYHNEKRGNQRCARGNGLKNFVRQLNNDNNNKRSHQIQIVNAYRLQMKVREKEEKSEGSWEDSRVVCLKVRTMELLTHLHYLALKTVTIEERQNTSKKSAKKRNIAFHARVPNTMGIPP